MKKFLTLALVLCMVLTAAIGSAAELLSAGDTYPLNSDKTITWYVAENMNPHEKFVSWKESPFHTGLNANLGVDIEWLFPTTGTTPAVFTNTLMADPDSLPNIMTGSFMDQANLLLEDEVIWDLTPYIQEYAPAYYAWLQTNPAYDKALKTDEGKYYAFGFFREDGGWNDTYLGPVVRKDWLDECGLEIPTTISEFENVIRVFNEKYGAKFSFAMTRFQYNGLAGAFGAYGTTNAGWSWFVKDGKVGLGQVQPEFRNYLSWLNMLWDEGLMDQDVITLDDTSIKAKVHNDQCGISVTSMGQMNNWNNERIAKGQEAVWVGCPYPKADDGSLSSVTGGFGIGHYTGVITKTADEETMKLCLQMLDYAYTQEGFLYWNYGTEGVSWVWGEDGIPKFTDLVNNDPDTDPMRKYNAMTFGGTGIQATNLLYLKNAPAAIEANNIWFYNFEDEEKNLAVTGGWRWPVGVTFTVDEMDMINIYGGSLNTFVSESFQAFLTGTMDIDDDATWEKYLKDAETYNLSKMQKIRQDCLDRYLSR